MQTLINAPSPLLTSDGTLSQVGWSPQPLLDSNLENAHFYKLRFLQPLRMKRWDYYGVTTPTHFFSFTISDIGYLGMIFVYVIDFAQKTGHEETIAIPFARGVMLPRNSDQGITQFINNRASLTFKKLGDERHLQIHWKNFENQQDFSANLIAVEKQEHESMNLVTPIGRDRFYFNRKINCMPVSGQIEYLGKSYNLSPQSALANLDWGRGVWAYESFWVWASASGYLKDGTPLGLNMGYGFGDGSQATENAFVLGGKLHKLGEVKFTYDPSNFMAPWQMISPDGKLNLTFTPFYERVARTDVKLLVSEVHQMFGNYNGTLKTDDGQIIEVLNLVGFAEEHHARW